MNLNPSSDTTAHFLERLVDFAENDKQRPLAVHQLGCVRLFRKQYDEAHCLIYSVSGLARLDYIKDEKLLSYEKLSSVISSVTPLGWMYQERSLYCDGDMRWKDLEKATDLDPTLVYPYMYRAASLIRTGNVKGALAEIDRVLGFKLSLECLELRFFIYLALDDYKAALRDVHDEGWILYDTGHHEEGLLKAEESISIKRPFEPYFLKAYALADSSVDSSSSSTVISLLEDALRCPSGNLRRSGMVLLLYYFWKYFSTQQPVIWIHY